jgi:hypothetical protein
MQQPEHSSCSAQFQYRSWNVMRAAHQHRSVRTKLFEKERNIAESAYGSIGALQQVKFISQSSSNKSGG